MLCNSIMSKRPCFPAMSRCAGSIWIFSNLWVFCFVWFCFVVVFFYEYFCVVFLMVYIVLIYSLPSPMVTQYIPVFVAFKAHYHVTNTMWLIWMMSIQSAGWYDVTTAFTDTGFSHLSTHRWVLDMKKGNKRNIFETMILDKKRLVNRRIKF